MPKKDYYLILGVSRTETSKGIRAAYRKLAKEHHPDRKGPGGACRFREIAEAYGVLSDPESRKSYNESLCKNEEARKGEKPRTVVGKRTWSTTYGPEPLTTPHPIAVRPVFKRSASRPPIQEADFITGRGIHSLPAGIFESSFFGHARPAVYELEVILTRDEAARGGILPLHIPVIEDCPYCGASGYTGSFPCLHCRMQGMIRTDRIVRLEIPGGTRGGDILRISPPQRATAPISYLVHILVQPN